MSKGLSRSRSVSAPSPALLGWFGHDPDCDRRRSLLPATSRTLDDLSCAGRRDGQPRPRGCMAMSPSSRSRETSPDKRVRFAVQNDPPHAGGPIGETLDVVYASLETPDLFKDGAEVVVEGRLTGSGDGSRVPGPQRHGEVPLEVRGASGSGTNVRASNSDRARRPLASRWRPARPGFSFRRPPFPRRLRVARARWSPLSPNAGSRSLRPSSRIALICCDRASPPASTRVSRNGTNGPA